MEERKGGVVVERQCQISQKFVLMLHFAPLQQTYNPFIITLFFFDFFFCGLNVSITELVLQLTTFEAIHCHLSFQFLYSCMHEQVLSLLSYQMQLQRACDCKFDENVNLI